MAEAIDIVSKGQHDPAHAHIRVKQFYDWMHIAERTERVYANVRQTRPRSFWLRMQRSVSVHMLRARFPSHAFTRTLGLGRFAGPIFAIILLVDCLFFAFLEWWIPRETIDKVEMHWSQRHLAEVRSYFGSENEYPLTTVTRALSIAR